MSELNVVMQQIPVGIDGQSPLYHADFASLAELGPKEGGVILRENKLMGLLTLRCPANDDQLAAMAAILGVALPLTPLTSVQQGAISIRWISPDEWLIVLPADQAFAMESRFYAEVPGHFSLVNVSGGLTILLLSGANAVAVLKKSTTVDLHNRVFPVGKVVSTVFAKGNAVIRRVDDGLYELVIRRSFADYLWLWIQDASREYGLVIED